MQQVNYVETRHESRYENYSSEMLYEEYIRLSMENIKLLDRLSDKLKEKMGDE